VKLVVLIRPDSKRHENSADPGIGLSQRGKRSMSEITSMTVANDNRRGAAGFQSVGQP
jgi:hypothetical protein